MLHYSQCETNVLACKILHTAATTKTEPWLRRKKQFTQYNEIIQNADIRLLLTVYLSKTTVLNKHHRKRELKNNYSVVCFCGTAAGVKMCDDKALGGATGNELWCFLTQHTHTTTINEFDKQKFLLHFNGNLN